MNDVEVDIQDNGITKVCYLINGKDVLSISTDGEGWGKVISNLSEQIESPEVERYNAAIDGLESTVLSLACAGVDFSDKKIAEAVFTAAEAIANNLM